MALSPTLVPIHHRPPRQLLTPHQSTLHLTRSCDQRLPHLRSLLSPYLPQCKIHHLLSLELHHQYPALAAPALTLKLPYTTTVPNVPPAISTSVCNATAQVRGATTGLALASRQCIAMNDSHRPEQGQLRSLLTSSYPAATPHLQPTSPPLHTPTLSSKKARSAKAASPTPMTPTGTAKSACKEHGATATPAS